MSFDKLAGIYVYCMDYHEGQWSRLYRILSRISKKELNLRDSSIEEVRTGDWEEAHEVYQHLKERNAQ